MLICSAGDISYKAPSRCFLIPLTVSGSPTLTPKSAIVVSMLYVGENGTSNLKFFTFVLITGGISNHHRLSSVAFRWALKYVVEIKCSGFVRNPLQIYYRT
jgi:hypothetical protein